MEFGMKRCVSDGILILAVACVAVAVGCSSGPTPVEVPPIEPEKLADAAMETYDQDGDGLLTEAELVACPPLMNALKKPYVDTDKDKSLSRDELLERFSTWANSGIGVSYLSCRVTTRGRPLSGAVVKLIPDPLFTDVISPAEGTTDGRGTALLAMDSANLPDDLRNLRAVQQGLYRVEITHPSVEIPAKYNTATTLGLEVSFDTGGYAVSFDL